MAQTFEVAIQLTGFRNVDLFSQGIYQLRFSGFGSRSGRKAVAVSAVDAPIADTPDVLLPAHTLSDTGEACSPSFRVRYCEEEVAEQHKTCSVLLPTLVDRFLTIPSSFMVCA